MKQTLNKAQMPEHFSISIISCLLLRFKKWKIRNKYYELDMDMQCTTMSYKQYCEDIALLDSESIRLNNS